MNKAWMVMALGCLWLGAQAQSADDPGSLWPQSYVNPILDRTARRVGDILTVVISENAVANFAATTATAKTDKTSIDQLNIPLLKGLFGGLGTGTTSSTSGTGSTNQTSNLTTTLSATVKQVLPNGNLVIEGTRSVVVNKETQTFKLTGVVRVDDVRSDNTVLSESLADAHISMDGKGQVEDRQRQGIIQRLLNWLF